MARGRLETTVTRRKKGDPAADRVAAAIMEEFSPKTAEEAQEALRSVFGPMIETMLKAELEAHLGHPDNDKGPKDGPNRRNGYTRVSVNLFFTSFAKQACRSRKGGFTGCANVFSPIPVTA